MATFRRTAPALGHLLAAADGAVARAAARGNGLVEQVEADAARATLGSSAWRAPLEKALAGGSFELYIQPVLALAGGATIQHEILARLITADPGERGSGRLSGLPRRTGVAVAGVIPMPSRRARWTK